MSATIRFEGKWENTNVSEPILFSFFFCFVFLSDTVEVFFLFFFFLSSFFLLFFWEHTNEVRMVTEYIPAVTFVHRKTHGQEDYEQHVLQELGTEKKEREKKKKKATLPADSSCGLQTQLGRQPTVSVRKRSPRFLLW